jgi:hypothetical protein
MDAAHEAGVNKLLVNIGKHPAVWGTPLDYREEGGFNVF